MKQSTKKTDEMEINWQKAMILKRPKGVELMKGAPRKYCVICRSALVQSQNNAGMIISRCLCNTTTRGNALVKYFELQCNNWHQIPRGTQRLNCKCGTSKFVCECEILHAVKATDNNYECDICNEKSDPFIK